MFPEISIHVYGYLFPCEYMYILCYVIFQTQFILVTVHSCQLLYMKDCEYPRLFCYWILSYAVIFLFMFAKFYVQAYRKPKKADQNANIANGKATNGTMSNGVKTD